VDGGDVALSLYDPRRFPAYRDYLAWVLRQGTTPNGVFGGKVMWAYLDGLVGCLAQRSGGAGLDDAASRESGWNWPRQLTWST
jgi:hypothetical protein